MGGDADRGVVEVGVEDVGAVSRRGHPCGDDRAWGGQPERAPADVLADFVADLRAVDIAGSERMRLSGVSPLRPVVFEVVAEGHVLGVALGGLLELRVGLQWALAVTGPFAVDQAEGGGADAFELSCAGRQVGVGAGVASGAAGTW